MNKSQLKIFLNNYYMEKTSSVLHKYLCEIYANETNDLLKKFIKYVVYNNMDYLCFIDNFYLSISAFYRLKNQLIDKLYHLLILDKKVSKEEILIDL